jgi:hypothetical protein
MRKAYTFCRGSHRSAIVPPEQVRGVEPKRPARKRKARWAPRFGARAAAMMKRR